MFCIYANCQIYYKTKFDTSNVQLMSDKVCVMKYMWYICYIYTSSTAVTFQSCGGFSPWVHDEWGFRSRHITWCQTGLGQLTLHGKGNSLYLGENFMWLLAVTIYVCLLFVSDQAHKFYSFCLTCRLSFWWEFPLTQRWSDWILRKIPKG